LDKGFAGIAGGVCIDTDTVAHGSAQQLVDRHAVKLALDVPERLFDTAEGTGQNRSAAIKRAAVEDLPVAVDLERVLADQVFFHLVHGCGDRPGTALDDRFAVADQAFVGMNFQKQPTRLDKGGFQLGDLHVFRPSTYNSSCARSLIRRFSAILYG
jgi:hypothetical protein